MLRAPKKTGWPEPPREEGRCNRLRIARLEAQPDREAVFARNHEVGRESPSPKRGPWMKSSGRPSESTGPIGVGRMVVSNPISVSSSRTLRTSPLIHTSRSLGRSAARRLIAEESAVNGAVEGLRRRAPSKKMWCVVGGYRRSPGSSACLLRGAAEVGVTSDSEYGRAGVVVEERPEDKTPARPDVEAVGREHAELVLLVTRGGGRTRRCGQSGKSSG